MGKEMDIFDFDQKELRAIVDAWAEKNDDMDEMERSGRIMQVDQEFWTVALKYLWENRDDPELIAAFQHNPQEGFDRLAEALKSEYEPSHNRESHDGHLHAPIKETVELYAYDLKNGKVGEVTYNYQGKDKTAQFLEAETVTNRTVYLYPPTCC